MDFIVVSLAVEHEIESEQRRALDLIKEMDQLVRGSEGH